MEAPEKAKMAIANMMLFKIKSKALAVSFWLALIITCLLPDGYLYGVQSEYDLIARNFLAFVRSNKQIYSTLVMEGSVLDSSNPIPIAHLVNLQGGGYILISASKSLTPIKAYSLHYNFDSLPDTYKNYLLLELEYGIRTVGEGKKTLYKSSGAITANQERWEFLTNYTAKKRLKTYEPDTFLIKTQWKQKAPYNKFCPQLGGQPVKVGCTNIAVGQLMKYHNHPPSGKGVETYTWNGQQLKAIFYKNYHWENMPDSLSSITPEYQIDETARLLRDIALANHSEFGVEATSAHVNIVALNKYFGYANTNSLVPYEGTYVSLTSYPNKSYLLWQEGLQYQKDTVYKRFSGPIHIEFYWQNKEIDEDERLNYIQDIFNLSKANWRGFKSKNVPISIYYCQLVAKFLKNFPAGMNSISNVQKPWFL